MRLTAKQTEILTNLSMSTDPVVAQWVADARKLLAEGAPVMAFVGAEQMLARVSAAPILQRVR